MAELQRFPLTTASGKKGYILRRARFIDSSEQSKVVLEDGTELMAASGAIEPQPDGSFLLRTGEPETDKPAEPAVEENRTEPQSRQSVASETTVTEPAIHPVSAASIPAAGELFADEIGIERVAINELVDELPRTRDEGDMTIIPVVEEVLVVQKRYMLKEEIRINRQRRPVAEPRRIMLDGKPAARS